MPELVHPIEEKACQLRAAGKTQLAAYNEAFEVPEDSKANNSSRFFRRADVKARVEAIKARRAILADLDDAWVIKRLKRMADANLDDFFAHSEDGRRFGIELEDVDRDKMAALQEVTVDEFLDKAGDDPERIRRTKIKLEPRLQALELIGKWLGMWPNKVALTNPDGTGPVEVTWKESQRADAA